MKQFTITSLLCLCSLFSSAQSRQPLTLTDVVGGTFRAENIYGVIPIPGDGEHYSQMNAARTQVVKYSFKTGREVEVLFDAATARECPFKMFDSYSFSPDGSTLLIATEATPIYRHSYTAVHYLYSLRRNLDGKINNVVERLSDGGPQQAPVFSPDATMVAFVRNNNIYLVKRLFSNSESRVTEDGEFNR
ncbi:MAG: DPP IV N-terminal domain-containing protein, partial [Prevotellaceae bacterium]|nr:DPP IV N-terminal domain-containing protein [Prevotellaceae bacterium]